MLDNQLIKMQRIPIMSRLKSYRHLPAFVLVLLAKEDLYGAAILNKMKLDMPFFFDTDLSLIYRLLQDLESIGAIAHYWDTTKPGPARKWYKLTKIGFDELTNYKKDIEKRMENFIFFMNVYENTKNKFIGSPSETNTDIKK